MARISHLIVTSPLARERGTELQSTNSSTLMAMVYDVMCVLMAIRGKDGMHFYSAELILSVQFSRPQARIARETDSQGLSFTDLRPPLRPTLSQSGIVIMPRLRGKSRRGAAWYKAESRRKRLQHFEKALILASTRRKKCSWSPPMAIVEEIRPEEAMLNHPPTVHPVEHTVQQETPIKKPSAVEEDLYPPCVIEEEIPHSTTREREKDKCTLPQHRKAPAQAQQSNRARRTRARRDR
jgi:hypothetical protein